MTLPLLLIWSSGALVHYLRLRSILLDRYSEIGWQLGGVRLRAAKRACFWFIPGQLYYWREARWQKEKDSYG